MSLDFNGVEVIKTELGKTRVSAINIEQSQDSAVLQSPDITVLIRGEFARHGFLIGDKYRVSIEVDLQ